MAAFGNAEMAQDGETFVDGVDEPETGDFLGRVSGAALCGGAASARERSAFFVEDVDERSGDDQQTIAGADLQARRNKSGVEDEAARTVAEDACDGEGDESLIVLGFQGKANVLCGRFRFAFRRGRYFHREECAFRRGSGLLLEKGRNPRVQLGPSGLLSGTARRTRRDSRVEAKRSVIFRTGGRASASGI